MTVNREEVLRRYEIVSDEVVMKCLVYMTSQCVDLKERVKALEMENRLLKEEIHDLSDC